MDVSFRPVAAHDAVAIHALLEDTMPVGGRDFAEWNARWEWSHHASPWRAPEVPLGIVAEQHGELVGHLGLTPVPLQVGGRPVVSQASESFVVSGKVQGQGLGRRLSAAAWDSSDVPQPVSFTANPTSTHLFEKFGGLVAPPKVNRTRLGVLDAQALVRRLRRSGRVAGGRAIDQCLRWAASAWIGGHRLTTRPPRGFDAVGIDCSEPQLDAMSGWQDAEFVSPFVDREYLHWRYEAAPKHLRDRYHVVGVRDASGSLRAVAAIDEHAHSSWGGCFAQLMEFRRDPEVRDRAMLACVLAYGRARGWVALRLPYLAPGFDAAARSTGFVREPRSSVSAIAKPVRALAELAPRIGGRTGLAFGMGCRW